MAQNDASLNRKVRQKFVTAFIERFQKRKIFLEIRSLTVGKSQGFKMTFRPRLGPINTHISDGCAIRYAPGVDRNRQPLFSLMSLDLIAVTPAMLIVLHIIIEDKQIRAADLVKIAPPGNVGRLQDDNVHFPTIS